MPCYILWITAANGAICPSTFHHIQLWQTFITLQYEADCGKRSVQRWWFMLPISMIQSPVFWSQGMPLRNIHPFNVFVQMLDIERLLSKMFLKNWALVLILLHAQHPDGRSCPRGGLWSVLWPGSTIPVVFPKTMKYLPVPLKLFVSLLLSALY